MNIWGSYLKKSVETSVKIFCSGRFTVKDSTVLLDALKHDYRTCLLGDVMRLLYPSDCCMVNDHIKYLGPFYFECDKLVAKDVVMAERKMIEECTDAVFIFDDEDCAGSIAELIYAATLHKRVHIFYVRHPERDNIQTPLWYPITLCEMLTQSCQIVSCDTQEEAEYLAINTILSL